MAEIKKMPFETYLAVINNSVGSGMFKEGFARIDGTSTDIMRGGELSCAFFVSSLLKIFNTIKSMHATVRSTVKDLEECGWQNVEAPRAGDVVVWKPVMFPDGEEHEHIGFITDENHAISNDYASGTPKKHAYKQTPDGTEREVEAIYRGRHLFESDK